MDPAPAAPLTPDEPLPSVHPLDEPEAGGRAIRGAVLRTGSFALGALLSVISAPLIIRHLGVADFGRYATVVALLAVTAGLTEGGLGPVGVREYAVLEGAERNRFMRNLLGLRLVLSAIGVAVGIGFTVVAGYDGEQIAGACVGGAGLIIAVTQSTYAVPLYAELRVGRQVAAELLGQVTMVVLVVIIVTSGGGIVALLGVPVPAGLLVLGLTVAFVRGAIPLRPAFELRRWRRVLRDTLPVGLATAVHTLYFRSVIVLMSLLAVAVQTGYFATSYRVTEVLIGIPVLLVATTFPLVARAAHTDAARLRYATQRLFETGVVAGIAMSGIVAIGAPFAISVLAGAEGEPAVPVLRILAITILLAFLSSTFGTVLLSLRRHRELVACSAAALAVAVGLAVGLVGPEGAIGGAVAGASGELALVVALGLALHRSEPGLRLSLGVLPRAVVPGLVAAGLAVALPVPAVVEVVVFSVLYAGLVSATRAVPPEIRATLLAPVAARARR